MEVIEKIVEDETPKKEDVSHNTIITVKLNGGMLNGNTKIKLEKIKLNISTFEEVTIEVIKPYFRVCWEIPSYRLIFQKSKYSKTYMNLDTYPGQCGALVISGLSWLSTKENFKEVMEFVCEIAKISEYSFVCLSVKESSLMNFYAEEIGFQKQNSKVINKRTNNEIVFYHKNLY